MEGVCFVFPSLSLFLWISLFLHQISSLVSALIVLLVLLFFAPFFYDLQKCVLACIIIVSLRGALRKFKDVPAKWRASRNDAIVWLVTMSATALISVEIGLLIGIIFSMMCIIFKTQNPTVSNELDTDTSIENWLQILQTTSTAIISYDLLIPKT